MKNSFLETGLLLERPNDKWLRIILIPLISLVSVGVSYKDNTLHWMQWVAWWIISSVFGLLMWEASIQWVLYVRRRYNRIEQTRQRVITTFIGYMVILVTLQSMLIQLAKIAYVNEISITADTYLASFVMGCVCLLLVGSVLEFMYYIRKYREAVQESEAVKKAGLQSQYDSLKNQVNPHFLFNALNSLSALISEDRQKAGLFLDELSSVYRYLLQSGRRPVVTLAEEMNFLRAYRYLLDTRFNQALRWEITVGDQWLDRLLPPLTLQTLIENALRLNTFMVDQPLTLLIATQSNGTLLVSNTIQRKKAAVLAPQGGLTLLAERYTALKLPAPLIDDDGERFMVYLPLTRKEDLPVYPPFVTVSA